VPSLYIAQLLRAQSINCASTADFQTRARALEVIQWQQRAIKWQ
jgi:hypothetical protein